MIQSLSQNSMIIALPKTKGSHRVGSYLSRLFEDSGINAKNASPRCDDTLYSYSRGEFIGIQSGSTESANNLLDGVVHASFIGLNRLVDTALERNSEEVSDIYCVPLNIVETRCKVAFACAASDERKSNFVRVVASHPSIATAYFNQSAMDVGKVILRESSTETQARRLFNHCPVVDITQTGNSLVANGYSCVKTIMDSEAVIAWRKDDSEQSVKITNLMQQLGLDVRKQKHLTALPIFQAK